MTGAAKSMLNLLRVSVGLLYHCKRASWQYPHISTSMHSTVANYHHVLSYGRLAEPDCHMSLALGDCQDVIVD